MKFHLNHDPANKTLTIPRAALQLSGLAETSDLTIHTENGCVLLLPEKLSVAQTLKTFQLLTAINAELLFRLAKSSALAHGAENDACDGCHWEKECFQDVLPLCMLAEAGIDPVEGDFECAVTDGTLVLRSGTDTNVYEMMLSEKEARKFEQDLKRINPDVDIKLDKNCTSIDISKSVKELKLPENFYLDENNRITNKENTALSVFVLLKVNEIKKNNKNLSSVTHYNNVDEKGVYSSSSNSSNTRPGDYMYDIYHPVTGKPCPKNGWRWPKSTFDNYEEEGEVAWGVDETTQPHIKKRIETVRQYLKSVIEKDNRSTTNNLAKLFDGKKVFDNSKPVDVIKDLIDFTTKRNAIILDFFAGSSTTADAVMQLNAEDGGHRKFIMVQLPEKTYHTNKDGKEVPTKGGEAAYGAGFKSIDEISRERIRRSAAKIREDNGLMLPEDFDGSFKHYRVVEPTKQALDRIEEFNPDNVNLFNDMVSSFSSDALNVAGNATGVQTILTTWLVRDGYSLDADVRKISIGGYTAYLVEESRLYLIDDGWTKECTRELLNRLGEHELSVQSIVLWGYSFNIAELRELEIGIKQLNSSVNLLKRY